MDGQGSGFMELINIHLSEQCEKAAEAVERFGRIEGDIIWGFVLDESELEETGGSIMIGKQYIKPKNSSGHKRIVIDVDPAYKYMLVRVCDVKN